MEIELKLPSLAHRIIKHQNWQNLRSHPYSMPEMDLYDWQIIIPAKMFCFVKSL